MLSFKITAFFSTKLAWKQNNSQVAESNTRKPKHTSEYNNALHVK